jgi:hypothetical protein
MNTPTPSQLAYRQHLQSTYRHRCRVSVLAFVVILVGACALASWLEITTADFGIETQARINAETSRWATTHNQRVDEANRAYDTCMAAADKAPDEPTAVDHCNDRKESADRGTQEFDEHTAQQWSREAGYGN